MAGRSGDRRAPRHRGTRAVAALVRGVAGTVESELNERDLPRDSSFLAATSPAWREAIRVEAAMRHAQEDVS
jgi:hypothetical protein